MSACRIVLSLTLGAVVTTAPASARVVRDSTVIKYRVEELALESARDERAFLARPVYLAAGEEDVYVVDAQDCAVKVFSKTGRFKSSFGRKGQGPGELDFPSGVSTLGGRFYVADKFNRRIQVFDGSGRSLGGFPVPFAPDKVLALAEDAILVTHNPTGRLGPEKMLHLYDAKGGLVWEGLEANVSGDSPYDALRNMILVNPGPAADFYVNFRSQDRVILHFNSMGRCVSRIRVDERYRFKPLTIPVRGPQKVLQGFCWTSAFFGGHFYFLAPDYTAEKDLGPGQHISVFNGQGRLEAAIDLPSKVVRIAVDAEGIFALDADDNLRIFRVHR